MNEVPLFGGWDQLSTVLLPFMVRCGVAALCGAMIGLERERKRKPAGFRTNILICVGAAIYMQVGLLLVNAGGAQGDPARIAAQVVTGIGFLGAGAIIQAGGRVTGLTTAASIWVIASIGLVAGAGFPLIALVAAVMVLLTLVVLGAIEERYLEGSDS
ncbi:MAG: MgtC/SapB family protein [Acidobacteria bacterium]|nr:MgtC/SapB family protein [Acidobacteriota bacterium]